MNLKPAIERVIDDLQTKASIAAKHENGSVAAEAFMYAAKQLELVLSDG